MDGDLLDRLRAHAAKRGMSVQDYIVRTLIRDDFDERLKCSVDETERFYETGCEPGCEPGYETGCEPGYRTGYEASPSAGIR
jgi:hypothetical protein